MENTKEDIFENNFFECPNCACVFVSQIDRENHLEKFGTNKYEHIQKLYDAHKKVDRTYLKRSLAKGSKNESSSNRKPRFYKY